MDRAIYRGSDRILHSAAGLHCKSRTSNGAVPLCAGRLANSRKRNTLSCKPTVVAPGILERTFCTILRR
jgi:hypothetical protein